LYVEGDLHDEQKGSESECVNPLMLLP